MVCCAELLDWTPESPTETHTRQTALSLEPTKNVMIIEKVMISSQTPGVACFVSDLKRKRALSSSGKYFLRVVVFIRMFSVYFLGLRH